MIEIKIIRAYIITAVICLCISASVSAFFVADENAKKIVLGEENTVVVFGSYDKELYPDSINSEPFFEKLKAVAEKAAGIAPPPVNNIYWFVVNSKRIMS